MWGSAKWQRQVRTVGESAYGEGGVSQSLPTLFLESFSVDLELTISDKTGWPASPQHFLSLCTESRGRILRPLGDRGAEAQRMAYLG